MTLDRVVNCAPLFGQIPNFIETLKPVNIEQRLSGLRVEAFDKSVPGWSARLDEVELHSVGIGSMIHHHQHPEHAPIAELIAHEVHGS